MDSNVEFGQVSANGGEVISSSFNVIYSLPYSVSVKALNDFKGVNDINNEIPINILSLDIDNLGYKNLSLSNDLFINNSPPGFNNNHDLKFKLANTLGYKSDVYESDLEISVTVL